jgi:nucleotide-binding universal stress UspA family protein
MTTRTILVLADGGAGSDSTLQMAVAVAQKFSAHLDVLHVKVEPESMVPIVGEGMSGVMVEQMMETMQRNVETRASQARAAYERYCVPTGVSTGWRELVGREPEVVAAAGRLADLIVLSRPGADREAPLAATLDAALFDSGRPVLIAPATPAGEIGRRIVLAWDGSAQAARAVSAALSFLARAEEVTVLVGGSADEHAPAPALLAYLARHEGRRPSDSRSANRPARACCAKRPAYGPTSS